VSPALPQGVYVSITTQLQIGNLIYTEEVTWPNGAHLHTLFDYQTRFWIAFSMQYQVQGPNLYF